MAATVRFSELNLADSTVLGYSVDNGVVLVVVRDWQEQVLRLRFEETIALESFSIEGEDLSHGSEDTSDPLIAKAVELVGESADEYCCFSFHAAWHSAVRMRVVAKKVTVFQVARSPHAD